MSNDMGGEGHAVPADTRSNREKNIEFQQAHPETAAHHKRMVRTTEQARTSAARHGQPVTADVLTETQTEELAHSPREGEAE